MLIRFLDFTAALFGLLLLWPIFLVVYVVGLFDTGSPIFVQERVGRYKKPFKLIKFRTMSVDTQSVASHLASTSSITKLGAFLRKTKIDELPQLINVLKGEMSLVGPRPNLFNQEELLIGEQVEGTAHPRIMKASELMLPWPQLRVFLAELDSACFRFDHEQIRSLLLSMPTGFNPTDGICDLVWQAKNTLSYEPCLSVSEDIDFLNSESHQPMH